MKSIKTWLLALIAYLVLEVVVSVIGIQLGVSPTKLIIGAVGVIAIKALMDAKEAKE